MPHALIVDGNAQTRHTLAQAISHCHYDMTIATATDLRSARIQLIRQLPQAVFIDLKLADGSGIDLFEDLEPYPNIKIIVITERATVESALSALKMGAVDYLMKPISPQRVHTILDQIPCTTDLTAKMGTSNLPGELHRFGRFGLMLGHSKAMQYVYKQINRVAPTDASVLLIGESGTGKELAAQTVHKLSQRCKRTFLAVNCGAISPNLTEAEMFGYERGAFTGADRQHKGYFEQANGGTLFLDEITEMPVKLQVKLLRVLETGVFMRVGAAKEIATDVRLIAATNRDPEEAVSEGQLRLDLYHRLNVFPIHLPPLRERGDDIQLLAQQFLDELNQRYRAQKTFSSAVRETLLSHVWPGNVRELRNYVERVYIMAGTKPAAPLPLSLPKSYSPLKSANSVAMQFKAEEAESRANKANKECITTYLDADILTWLRTQVQARGDYQTLINEILRTYVKQSVEAEAAISTKTPADK